MRKRFWLGSVFMAVTGCLLALPALAQTPGDARLEVTLLDYNGSGARHWTLVWVTTESGTFIKTLWKQGTKYAFNSSQWTTHCPQWNAARGGPNGSTVVDGYTSATATSYTGTNSPVILTWNGHDASDSLMPDGKYKFWVQYAEDSSSPGPYTTSGLLWTKGAAAATTTYPNQGSNFADMRVVWTPSALPPTAPTITTAPLPATGTVGVPYNFTCTAQGTEPINFSASGLPTGVQINLAGVVSGVPTTAGTFNGIVTAANGTLPNATQPFAIVVSVVPTSITLARAEAGNLVMGGTGPANGGYTVLTSASAAISFPQWSIIGSGTFDAQGRFGFTNAINPALPQLFYSLRVP